MLTGTVSRGAFIRTERENMRHTRLHTTSAKEFFVADPRLLSDAIYELHHESLTGRQKISQPRPTGSFSLASLGQEPRFTQIQFAFQLPEQFITDAPLIAKSDRSLALDPQ